MVLQVRKIRGIDRTEIFLRGGVLGGLNLKTGLYGLDGLTLILSSPTVVNPVPPPATLPQTVTFSTSPVGPQGFLQFRDILDQINAVLVGAHAKGIRGELVIVEDTPSVGVTVDQAGTVNTLLGFSGLVDTVGTVYAAPGGGAPELVKVGMTALSDGSYVVVTDE